MMGGAATQLMFTQLEFTHAIGPQPGVYLLAGEQPFRPEGEPVHPDVATGASLPVAQADTLVIGVVAGPPARRARGLLRRPRSIESGAAPRGVSLAVVTLVKAATPLGRDAAATLLQRCRESEELQEQWIAEALAALNTAIRAYRGAAGDPYIGEVSRVDPRAVRIGHATGTALTWGRWEEAFECPPLRRSRLTRSERLRPSLAVAGALGGRLPLLECDELLLRLLLDVDEGRPRAAAVQVRGALALLLAELGDLPLSEEIEALLARLTERIPAADRLAGEAQRGRLTDASTHELRALVDEMLAALEAWRYETLEAVGDDESVGAEAEPARVEEWV